MNYYQPLEKSDEFGKGLGIFHMTRTNDNRVHAIGYCRENNCQHKTPIEASDCYRKYIREKCDGLFPGGFDMDSEDGTVFTMFGSY